MLPGLAFVNSAPTPAQGSACLAMSASAHPRRRKTVVLGQRDDGAEAALIPATRISEEESVRLVSMNCQLAKSEKSSGSKSVLTERGPTTTTSNWSQTVCRRRALAVVRMVSKESGETITTDSAASCWLSVMVSSQIQGECGGAPHPYFTFVSETLHPVQSPHLSGIRCGRRIMGQTVMSGKQEPERDAGQRE